jgi:glycosyltransferase involved in cell wall biosynthesis
VLIGWHLWYIRYGLVIVPVVNLPTKRILVVAMLDSIHTARWLTQFETRPLSIVVFPSTPHRRVHPLLHDLINRPTKLQISIAPTMTNLALPLGIIDLVVKAKLRARILKWLIRTWNPHIIHGLETQHAGYMISDAVYKLETVPPFYLSIWGSDLVWFRRFAKHKAKIQRVLSQTSFLGVECSRDIELAQSMGFSGQILPIVPASGGISISANDALTIKTLPSQRKKIAVKGYSGFVGRSITALSALNSLQDELADFEIVLYSASHKSIRFARKIAKRTGLKIVCHKKHALSHNQMISLFAESRISISISLSDGFPGSLREAMMTGCFPIESTGSCGSEWADSDRSALFVDPLDLQSIVCAVRRGLSDDKLVDDAMEINQSLARSRFSPSSLESSLDIYYA